MIYLSAPQVVFEDRHDAGKKLATELQEYSNQPVVVLAIPNGGVPIGLEVAKALKADFDVVISRKIPLPLSPEAGFGAIADDGTIILNEDLVKKAGLTQEQIELEAMKVREAIKKRSLLYKGDRPLVILSGKTVIITDDGLASGYTMIAAVESVRRRRPKEIVVAVPVASVAAMEQVGKAANKLETCVVGTMPRFAVADFYRHWYDVSDKEVVQHLSEWRSQHLSWRRV